MLPNRLSEPGPLLEYLSWLMVSNPRSASDTAAAIREMVASPNGRIFMDLLEKSVETRPNQISESVSALLARNAQAFILADLRRLATNETEQLLAKRASVGNTGRGRTKP